MNSVRLLFSAFALATFACASGGSRSEQSSPQQAVLVLDGEVRSCENAARATPGTCHAADLMPATDVLRSYVVPGESASVFYGSMAAAGAVVVVTRSFDLSRTSPRFDPLLHIVDGQRYRCPPAGRHYFDGNPYTCAPAEPPTLAAQIAWIRTVRTPQSIELFGRDAVGGAIVVALKPGSRDVPPGTSGILRAAVLHVHGLLGTRAQISIDPRVLVQSPFSGAASEGIHPYQLLAETSIPYTTTVVSSDRARMCDNVQASGCAQNGVASFVAFTEPRLRGDSATFDALLRYWSAPTIQELARSALGLTAPDRVGYPPITTRYRLELVRRDGVWRVIRSSLVGRS